MEQWIDVAEHQNYQVSTAGQVRNKHTGRILKSHPDRYGYHRVSLGNKDNVYIHRLVCENFYGKPVGDKTFVNHIDCNRENNNVLNVQWCSPRDNVKWGLYKGNVDPSIGLEKAREVNLKAVRIIELNKVFDSVSDCARFLGVPATNISRCLTGSRKGQRLHGYHIEYI